MVTVSLMMLLAVLCVGLLSLSAVSLRGKHPHQVTRAYLTGVSATGRHAWWIGAENHKAKVDLAKRPRSLRSDEWETAQGNTAEVGVGALPGFEALDSDAFPGDKLVTVPTLVPAGVNAETVRNHFFDLTAASRGVLASVRSGPIRRGMDPTTTGGRRFSRNSP